MDNLLVSFDSIINTDLGILYAMKEKYNNPEFINVCYLNLPEPVLLSQLVDREEENPLLLCLNEKYKDNANKLLVSLWENDSDLIYNLSKPNDIFKLMRIYTKSNLMQLDIFCKNVQEEQIINKYLKEFEFKVNSIIIRKGKINLDKYNTIYLKKYSSCSLFENVDCKSIYICNYKFNFEKDTQVPLYSETLSIGVNKISIIDTYNNKNLIRPIG